MKLWSGLGVRYESKNWEGGWSFGVRNLREEEEDESVVVVWDFEWRSKNRSSDNR